MSLPQGRDWLHPSCCDRKPCDCTWSKYFHYTQKFCRANKLILFCKQGRANLTSCRTAKSQVSLPLFIPETLCHNQDISKCKYLCKGYTSSWCVPPPRNVIAHFCSFLHLLYSPAIQISWDIYKLLLSLKKKKEPYVFQHCCFYSGDFIVQITHQQLGSFLCKMWWEMINFYARVFLYSDHNFT